MPVPPSPEAPAARPGPWLSRGVWGIGLASLLSDWGHETATALLPILLATLQAPAFALGVIEGVADGLSSLAKLLGGWLADRPSWRKPIAVAGYLIVGLSTFAFGFVRRWPQVLWMRTVGWVGRGGKGPSKDALLAESVHISQLGRAFGLERAMDTTGAILGPACAIALVAATSIPAAMRWTLVPGILAALALATLVPGGRASQHHAPISFFANLRQLPPAFRRFLGGVLVFGLGDFAHTLLIFRAAQVLTPRHGTARAAALAIALYTLRNLLAALGAYPAGALGDRFGKRGLLAIGYALATVMCLGFLLAPARLAALAALFSVAGMYTALEEALEKSLAAELLPLEVRGSGFGVLATVNGLGDFLSSSVVGFLWSAVAPAAGFCYAAAACGLGALLIARVR